THDVATSARASAAAPSTPIMPAASFARPPAVKSPSPYARPATPAFYFPPTQTVVVPTAKRIGVAIALAVLFGLLGIHRIYLDRTASGIVMLLVALANAATVVVAGMLPIAGLAALGLWWLTDLFRIRGMVRAANARRCSAYA
ncbi:TM2 domain-containing protein, partial [Burkholderia cenocepacia]|uniref:TM2 domain-containing protein n=1 Tax=Burkholderia cenocepacia TaxID=95486 RepID=UPI0038CC10B6